MKRYRFFYIEDGHKWYYTSRDYVAIVGRAKPGVFTEADWEAWGNDGKNEREELAEDELMRLLDAPRLPGFEA